MRLHQGLGYFLGIILLQQVLKVRIWHRRKATGRWSPTISLPNLLNILLLFSVPPHQPRVLGTRDGVLWDQPQPAPACRAAALPASLPTPRPGWWHHVPPSPETGSEGLSQERPLSQPWCCDPERRADGRVGSGAAWGQTRRAALRRHPPWGRVPAQHSWPQSPSPEQRDRRGQWLAPLSRGQPRLPRSLVPSPWCRREQRLWHPCCLGSLLPPARETR